MNTKKLFGLVFFMVLTFGTKGQEIGNSTSVSTDYNDLVALFKTWRSFEKPPLKEGAPDYTKATFDSRWAAFETLRSPAQRHG